MISKVNDSGDDNINETLTTDVINALLTGKPADLIKMNEDLMCKLIVGYRFDDMKTYVSVKGSHKPSDEKNANPIFALYNSVVEKIENSFNYESLIVRANAGELARLNGRNTCAYCNRKYTLTIDLTNKQNPIRPEFDHWFPKSLFPLLALSYYNLIPSCHMCNSNVKGSEVFNLQDYYHPYAEKFPPRFFFRALLVDGKKWTPFVCYPTLMTDASKKKEENTIKAFHLEEIYKEHASLEVADIMDFATKNNPLYLRTLFKAVLKDLCGEKSLNEVYRMMFGVELDKDKFLDRPFSKLKHDLLEQCKVIAP